MPPKHKFSKEQIIDAAFTIAKLEGLDGITIRKVAEQLHSSVAPVYVNFLDMEELKEAVVMKFYAIQNKLIQAQNSKDIFHNIGIIEVKLAKAYSLIFKDLVLKRSSYMNTYDKETELITLEQMKKDPHLVCFDEEDLREILMKMKIFQIGLSIMATEESFASDLSEERIIALLGSTGEDIIHSMKAKKTIVKED